MDDIKTSKLLKKSEVFPNFSSDISVASPGRINLIGEHTDYNGGFVLPTAIDRKIYFEFRKNFEDNKFRIFSETFHTYFEFDLNTLIKQKDSWKNYIIGVVDEIQKSGKSLPGFDCVIKSELPIGAGVSSSAALECGLATGLNELFNLNFSKLEIVELSQRAENNFVGSNCGIMDQYASVMSKENHLILLDCRSLKAEFIPADFQDCTILLLNTNVAHNLAEGEYNSRRRTCEEVALLIQEKYAHVKSLREVTTEMLAEFKNKISPEKFQRCNFVLQENERVLEAATAVKQGKLADLGQLMYNSHAGLKDEYEVSCPELDFLVDYSKEKDFIYGSRMMGGGFGGCTINIIKKDKAEDYIQEVSKAYLHKFGIKLDAFTVLPSAGTTIAKK